MTDFETRPSSPIEKYYSGKRTTSQQRYDTVIDHLRNFDGKISKIVEFGCSKMHFIDQLIFTHTDISYKLSEICLVDINKYQLENNMYKIRKTDPERTSDLTVNIFTGSIGIFDECLANTDAVIGIEIIEHLYENTLEAVAYNVFGRIKPKIALFTTPNCEYNPILGITGFRHSDHKFEWTREQFYDWSSNICDRFPYYSFHIEHIGGCFSEKTGAVSQLAVFKRNLNHENVSYSGDSVGICSKNAYFKEFRYKLLSQETVCAIPREDLLFKLINRYVENLQHTPGSTVLKKAKIPLVDVVNSINESGCVYKDENLFVTKEEVKHVIKCSSYKLERLKVPRRGFYLCIVV